MQTTTITRTPEQEEAGSPNPPAVGSGQAGVSSGRRLSTCVVFFVLWNLGLGW